MKKVGLFDADIFAFQATCVAQFDVAWDSHPNIIQRFMDFGVAKGHIKSHVEQIKKRLGLDEVVMCLTDKDNWRLRVNPEYKSNRKYTDRPVGLRQVKDWIAEEYESFTRPSLEADDVMGILATWDKYKPEYRKIIISEDKDMKTIPCYLYNPAHDFSEQLITEEQADLNFYSQAIGGDRVDGYEGCAGVGVKTAMDFLTAGEKPEAYTHIFKSGARKGEEQVRWKNVPSESHWQTTLALYRKAGQSDRDALRNARMARILRASDYDFKNKEAVLWTPPKVTL